jgi:hypothetical protein
MILLSGIKGTKVGRRPRSDFALRPGMSKSGGSVAGTGRATGSKSQRGTAQATPRHSVARLPTTSLGVDFGLPRSQCEVESPGKTRDHATDRRIIKATASTRSGPRSGRNDRIGWTIREHLDQSACGSTCGKIVTGVVKRRGVGAPTSNSA